ncbi:MAG: hypothetical protein P9L91_06345 [Candidatus Zophobacter franzmannii]|nr:hypothetical protein [Candidatus Zophobacter franzmannii]
MILILLSILCFGQHNDFYFKVNVTPNTVLTTLPIGESYENETIDFDSAINNNGESILSYDGIFDLQSIINVITPGLVSPEDMCILHFYPSYDTVGNPIPTVLPYSLDLGIKKCFTLVNPTGDPTLFTIDTGLSAGGASAIIKPNSGSDLAGDTKGCTWVIGFNFERTNSHPTNQNPWTTNSDEPAVYAEEENYTLIWDELSKSNLINKGNYFLSREVDNETVLLPWYQDNVFNEECILCDSGCESCYNDFRLEDQDYISTLRDIDLSRKDIGAKPYLPQENDEYVIENSVIELGKIGYNWVCLPGIDELRTGTYYDVDTDEDYSYNEAHNVFGNQAYHYNANDDFIHSLPFGEDADIIDEISWSYNGDGTIELDGTTWTNLTEPINSHKGYKLKLHDESPDAVYLEFDGFKNGSDNNNSSYTDMKIYRPGTNDNTKSTLVGYYQRNSQTIFDAIPSTVLNQMAAIKTRHWSAINFSYLNTQQNQAKTGWLISWMGTESPTLNYGEAVDFVCWAKYAPNTTNTDPIPISWDPQGTAVTETVVELPTCFEYEEEKDYYPVVCSFDMDELDDGDKPIEIAVFVGDTCKGATVIKIR